MNEWRIKSDDLRLASNKSTSTYDSIVLEKAADALDAQAEQIAALKAELEWCIAVIDHEVKPPESCGACGTPNANCGGECADAYYFAEHMRAARAALAPETDEASVRSSPSAASNKHENDANG